MPPLYVRAGTWPSQTRNWRQNWQKAVAQLLGELGNTRNHIGNVATCSDPLKEILKSSKGGKPRGKY